MRLILTSAALALALAACSNNDQADNTQNVDENLTAEDIVSNDVTAIDAVTGDAANMAADVNYTETENLAVNAGNATKPASRPSAARPAPARPADEPATNAAAPSNSTSE
jgi:hypothetical protein